MALEIALASSGLDHNLLERMKLRASQINGCTNCIHMHASDGEEVRPQAGDRHDIAPFLAGPRAIWREE